MSFKISLAKSFLDAKKRFGDRRIEALITSKIEDFIRNPDDPKFGFEPMKGTKYRWWKFPVNDDLRVIVDRREDELILCHVGIHDDAYEWAERRYSGVNNRTGEIQIIEVREEVRTIVRNATAEPPLFEKWDDAYLLGLGVPEEYLYPLRSINTEDSMWRLFNVLPEEVAVRLDDLQKGLPVPMPICAESVSSAIDEQLCFARIDSEFELRQALESPMEKWIIFLHPTQKKIAEAGFDGPARITGSAGTGKSVVALHRAVNLAKSSAKARVLFTTHTTTLAEETRHKLSLLLGDSKEIRDRVEVNHLHHVARSLTNKMGGRVNNQVDETYVRTVIERSANRVSNGKIPSSFLISEWESIIDPWGIRSWDEYEKASRAGRGKSLQSKQKASVWEVFDDVITSLNAEQVVTHNQLLQEAVTLVEDNNNKPFDHIVADEAQDFSPTALRLLRAMVDNGPNDLFMCRDAGQSIYGSQFSLKDVGIDVVGRSRRLRRNYRTTRQIQAFAEKLLPNEMTDGEGDTERREAVSILSGPEPVVELCAIPNEEIEFVANHLKHLLSNGAQPNEMAIFARAAILKERAEAALSKCDLPWHYLKEGLLPSMNRVSLSTMHRARGLEFRIVVVMGCDLELLPHARVLENQFDDIDRENIIEKDKHAFYVACTRARENLLVTCSGQPSVFLQPFL